MAVGLPVLVAVLLITEFGILEETDSAPGSAAAEAAPRGSLEPLLSAAPSDVLALGPTAPVAETAADLPPPAARVYVVVPGDVLHVIARRFGVTTEALAAYNALSNPDALRVGQELRVPPAGYVPPSEAGQPGRAGGGPAVVPLWTAGAPRLTARERLRRGRLSLWGAGPYPEVASGSGAVRQRASFGTKRSEVQILSPRPLLLLAAA